jgi:hypothetical protein
MEKRGTVLVTDLNPQGNSIPLGLNAVNNDLYFGTFGFPAAGLYKISNDNNSTGGDSLLNTPLNRFQNSQRLGTYLFAGEAESINIRQNFPNFFEEGVAFKVETQPADGLIAMTRFQNTAVPGTYLYAGEAESANIRQNFPNFVEERKFSNIGSVPVCN